jgi:alpha-ketoglutarate-dependent taurine dioxygenase
MRAQETLDLRTATSPQVVAERIFESSQRARVVYVRAHPLRGLERQFWEDVVSCGARVAVDEDAITGAPTGALWSDVSFDPAHPHTFRHSSAAQPLHTDGSYIPSPPSTVFLICSRAARSGGATLFLDAMELVDGLYRDEPALLEALLTRHVRFKKGDNVVNATLIGEDACGWTLRWNYYALDPHIDAEARRVAERFHAHLARLTASGHGRALLLAPSDAVFFADSRVLHGREAFSATVRGERCLWKGGLRLHAS